MNPARTLRHLVGLVLLSAAAVFGGLEPAPVAAAPTGLLAQAQPAAPAQPVFVRSWYLEIGLVVVLFAGALFAVCKSSRRT